MPSEKSADSDTPFSMDPLLAYIQSRPPPSSTNGLSAQQAGSNGSGGLDVQAWEVPFSELKLKGPLGEGSFSKVDVGRGHAGWGMVVGCACACSSSAAPSLYDVHSQAICSPLSVLYANPSLLPHMLAGLLG